MKLFKKNERYLNSQTEKEVSLTQAYLHISKPLNWKWLSVTKLYNEWSE